MQAGTGCETLLYQLIHELLGFRCAKVLERDVADIGFNVQSEDVVVTVRCAGLLFLANVGHVFVSDEVAERQHTGCDGIVCLGPLGS